MKFSFSSINLYKKIPLALAVSAVLSAPVMAASPEFSGGLELDFDASTTDATDTVFDQDGFVELNVSSRREKGDHFVMVKGGIRLTSDGDNDVVVRDTYIQFGDSSWDLQIGRFEAINLFPLGKDTAISNAGVTVYEANKVRGFVGTDGGQIVLHAKASDSVSFELDTLFGDGDVSGDGDSQTSFAGIRPSVTFGSDTFSLTAGMESVQYDLAATGDVDQTGVAIAMAFGLENADVNLAIANLDDKSTGATVEGVTSFTANFTSGNFGAGIILSKEDLAAGGPNPDLRTIYAAYTIPLFGIEDASVTLAASHSAADNVADDSATMFRTRFNYTF